LEKKSKMSKNTNIFRKKLKELREKAGYSQQELGDLINLRLNTFFKRNTISNYEHGHSQPNFEVLLTIAEIFDISLDYLFGLKNSPDNLELKGSSMDSASSNENVLLDNEQSRFNIRKDDNQDMESNVLGRPKEKVKIIDNFIAYVSIQDQKNYLSLHKDAKFILDLPKILLPNLNKGLYRAFEMKGNSMYFPYSGINNNDIVFGKNLKDVKRIKSNQVYVILCKENGLLIKRVFWERNRKELLCLPNNINSEEYFQVKIEDVQEVWEISGKISVKYPKSEEFRKEGANMNWQVFAMFQRIESMMELDNNDTSDKLNR